MTSPRILLTGANGFVGRQILTYLPQTAEIHATTNSAPPSTTNVTWHQADLRDQEKCRRLMAGLAPDVLIHAAWNTSHGAFWEAEDNHDWLAAGRALFSAFVDHGGKRIVGCGTCAEYAGMSAKPRREEETDSGDQPETLYGRTKLALRDHLAGLGIDYAWARIFLVYGEGEGKRRLVPSVARSLLAGDAARCSSGEQLRDFLDVRDLGRAIAQLAQSAFFGTINLGHGDFARIADVVTLLGEIAGRPELIELGALPARPGESAVLVPDLTRQETQLGFTPGIDLRAGLTDALSYWSTRN
jgi:nucleoside-diphosphate-sugar epimerase